MDMKSDTVEFVLTKSYFENLGVIMDEYLTTTSVGDLIRKARGTQELPKEAGSIDSGINNRIEKRDLERQKSL